MSTPTIYPPVQPGVCDAGVTYTFVLLARNTSVISCALLDATAAANNVWIHAVDALGGISAAPGDMAVRIQATCYDGPFYSTARSYTFGFLAQDNMGNSVTATQTIVARPWTNAGGASLTFATSNNSNSPTFGLSAHGLSVGDRVFITGTANPLATGTGVNGIGLNFATVTAVPDANHFTVALPASLIDWPYSGFDLTADNNNHQHVLYFLTATQHGSTQGDITSAALVAGTAGTTLSYTVATSSVSAVGASGVPSGIGLQGNVLSGTPVIYGWYPAVLTAGTMQRLMLFEISPGSWAGVIIAPAQVNCIAGLSVAVPITSPTLAGDSVTWTLNGAPPTLALANTSSTGATLGGSFAAPGTYPVQVTAASGAILASATISFVVAGAGAATPVSPVSGGSLLVPWLHGDLSLTDLQFDLRTRSVASYYMAGGALSFMESDSCKLAVLLLDSAALDPQATDATTLWFTARVDVDVAPVIDLAISGSGALTTVTGGSYYLIPLNLSADPVLDAINDLDDPGNGAPAVLALHCQLAVQRASGQVARSQVFVLSITERVTDAGLPALNAY